ncbi:MAG: DUF2062 domain-containing protein [Leptospiraceae bacterium]|nr:DUF2062 domain-containing protein [Leptospiraceae bacterium]
MKEFLKKRVTDPIINLLKQGVTPEKIALSIGFGCILGVFPVLGSTVILCMIVTFAFKLNLVAIQLANYLVYPLQFVFFIPLIRIGELILSREPYPLSMELIYTMLRDDMIHAIRTLFATNMCGVLAWFLIAPFVLATIYYLLVPVLRKIPIIQGDSK